MIIFMTHLRSFCDCEFSLEFQMVNYEHELVQLNLCELNFELVLVNYELVRYCVYYT